jgi:hypothetical protein
MGDDGGQWKNKSRKQKTEERKQGDLTAKYAKYANKTGQFLTTEAQRSLRKAEDGDGGFNHKLDADGRG